MNLEFLQKGLIQIGVVTGLIIGTEMIKQTPVVSPPSSGQSTPPEPSPSLSPTVSLAPIASPASSGELNPPAPSPSPASVGSPTPLPPKYSKFFCGNYQHQHVMFVRTPHRGNVPVVSWEKRIGNLSPEDRCRIVAERFRRFDSNEALKYITTGTMNHQPVVCVAAYQDGPCLPNGLLVTITSTSTNPERILDQIRTLNQWHPLAPPPPSLALGEPLWGDPSPFNEPSPPENPLW